MSDRIALVTGAAGGIGGAVVNRFVHAGWNVVALDRRSIGRASSSVRSVVADLSEPDQIVAVFEELSDREGRLDALVNNAAIQIVGPLAEMSVTDWDRLMAVNLRAPFLCLREAVALLEGGDGSVVNVSSVHAAHTSPGMAAYAATKGGLEAYTRGAALELAPRGIRVNAVRSGAVNTRMLRAGVEERHQVRAGPADLEDLASRLALGRVASPDEIAEVVHFLADADRSSFMTGATVVVDGGATVRLSTE